MFEQQGRQQPFLRSTTLSGVDQGLRSYMLKVYGIMTGAVAFTALISWLIYTLAGVQVAPSGVVTVSTAFGAFIFNGITQLVCAILFFITFLALPLGIRFISAGMATLGLFFAAGIMGVTGSSILAFYAPESIYQTFMVTTIAFGALSLYGYTTKRNLSAVMVFCLIAFVGVTVASLINLFLHSSGLSLVISIVGVIAIAGITAWDVQNIKEMYYWQGIFSADPQQDQGKKAVLGALRLYLDFVNMFLFLLQLMGNRR